MIPSPWRITTRHWRIRWCQFQRDHLSGEVPADTKMFLSSRFIYDNKERIILYVTNWGGNPMKVYGRLNVNSANTTDREWKRKRFMWTLWPPMSLGTIYLWIWRMCIARRKEDVNLQTHFQSKFCASIPYRRYDNGWDTHGTAPYAVPYTINVSIFTGLDFCINKANNLLHFSFLLQI